MPDPTGRVVPEGTVADRERKWLEGVILPAEAATAVLCQCSRDSLGVASGSWTPTLSDLAEMEARLPDYVRARPQAAMPNKRRDSRIYLRQYVGIERGGRRRIYVNLLGGEIFYPPAEPPTDAPLNMPGARQHS